MNTSFNARAGVVDLGEAIEFHNPDFGYTLFEEVVDPADPDGPRAIAMHVPANGLSKVWELVEPDYSERVELLSGSASLVVNRAGTDAWITTALNSENLTADDIEISQGDKFCVVTKDEEAVVLSRPSKPFDISFERGLTTHPTDELSRFIIAYTTSLE